MYLLNVWNIIINIKMKMNRLFKKINLSKKIAALILIINSIAYGQQNIKNSNQNEFCLKTEQVLELEKILIQNEWFHLKTENCIKENKAASELIESLKAENEATFKNIKTLRSEIEALKEISRNKDKLNKSLAWEKDLQIQAMEENLKVQKRKGFFKGIAAGSVGTLILTTTLLIISN